MARLIRDLVMILDLVMTLVRMQILMDLLIRLKGQVTPMATAS